MSTVDAPTAGAPSILVLGGGPPRPALVEELGADRATALRRLLDARANAWAQAAFPGATVRLAGDDAPTALAAALAPATHPRLVIVPELARWPSPLAAEILDDLWAGSAVTIGPVFDGGLYLLGLAANHPGADPTPGSSDPHSAPSDLAEALGGGGDAGLGGRQVMIALIGLAEREGWEVGLLATERGVRAPGDIRALRADPLTDPELRAVVDG